LIRRAKFIGISFPSWEGYHDAQRPQTLSGNHMAVRRPR
jgi:hypothetical protein